MRTVVRSDKNSFTLQLPDDLVGRVIEIIAFPVEDNNTDNTDTSSIESRVADLKNRLKKFKFNSGGYKFDRDEANDYE